jgi:hypothetical protein
MQRIEKEEHQTQQQHRQYRTRKDLFNGLFEQHLVPLLKANPKLQPITLLDELADKTPNQFDQSHLRMLQRRVKRCHTKEDPDPDPDLEVIFLPRHTPGDMGISDYTWMNKLNITLCGNVFKHKLYHYRLVYSGWTYVQVIRLAKWFLAQWWGTSESSYRQLKCGL